MQEILLLLDPNRAKDILGGAGNLHVIQQLPPRLAVVQTDADGVAALRAAPGVAAIVEDVVPDAVSRQLTPTERMFTDAWVVSRQPKQNRRGDKLPWDSEGFQPP